MDKVKKGDRGKNLKGQLLSIGDLTALLGKKKRSIQYWVEKGLLIPARVNHNQERKSYFFDFENLLQARLIADMLESGIGVEKLLKIQKNLKAIGFSEKLKHGFLIIKGNKAELISKDRKGRDRYFDAVTGQALLFSTNGTFKAVKKMLDEEKRVRKLLEDQEQELKTITV
ncbi:MAG: MerR family transcriptional regulator [Thermotogaceae bacterium]|nr:MerR family transcriptional regulator [Thermotogaceae bacterium]